jgi:DUF971 family protein
MSGKRWSQMLVLVKELKRLSNNTFSILWSDDRSSVFTLSDLQKNCPCARCQESKGTYDEDVKATKISSVGNYALRIDFTKGCSRGIFTFQFLRTIHLEGF